MANMLTSQTGFFESDVARRELVGVGDFVSARVQTIIVAGRQKSVAPSTFQLTSAGRLRSQRMNQSQISVDSSNIAICWNLSEEFILFT
jgi:hypothetical protein